jgi:glyoxylase-like metal-dependent hydrolase (beta-lactamase superfamily II)
MPHRNDTDRPILGLVCGNKYSLVVDSGNSPNHAKEFLEEVSLLNVPPVKYLVITHYHWDHIFGIKEMNLTTIAHEKTKQEIDRMKNLNWDEASLAEHVKANIISENCSKFIKEELKDIENFKVGDVDLTYIGSLEIDLGGVTCVVNSIGGSHTDDSTVIYIPEEKVMFLGDCIYGRRFNGLYGYDREKLLNMIDKIEKYKSEYYFISHEEIFGRKELEDFWQQLRVTAHMAGNDTSTEAAVRRFVNEFNREPTEDEVFYIEGFINANKAEEINKI